MKSKTQPFFCLLLCVVTNIALTQDAASDNDVGFPHYFVGKFEDRVPKLIGGTVPEIAFTLNCTEAGSCVV